MEAGATAGILTGSISWAAVEIWANRRVSPCTMTAVFATGSAAEANVSNMVGIHLCCIVGLRGGSSLRANSLLYSLQAIHTVVGTATEHAAMAAPPRHSVCTPMPAYDRSHAGSGALWAAGNVHAITAHTCKGQLVCTLLAALSNPPTEAFVCTGRVQHALPYRGPGLLLIVIAFATIFLAIGRARQARTSHRIRTRHSLSH
jgi:hypothetical protein